MKCRLLKIPLYPAYTPTHTWKITVPEELVHNQFKVHGHAIWNT